VHLVTRSHFRSRDKDGSHTDLSAIVENPMLHANFTTLCSIELELLPIVNFYIAGVGIFDLFGSCNVDLHPITFTYALNPYPLEMYTG